MIQNSSFLTLAVAVCEDPCGVKLADAWRYFSPDTHLLSLVDIKTDTVSLYYRKYMLILSIVRYYWLIHGPGHVCD